MNSELGVVFVLLVPACTRCKTCLVVWWVMEELLLLAWQVQAQLQAQAVRFHGRDGEEGSVRLLLQAQLQLHHFSNQLLLLGAAATRQGLLRAIGHAADLLGDGGLAACCAAGGEGPAAEQVVAGVRLQRAARLEQEVAAIWAMADAGSRWACMRTPWRAPHAQCICANVLHTSHPQPGDQRRAGVLA